MAGGEGQGSETVRTGRPEEQVGGRGDLKFHDSKVGVSPWGSEAPASEPLRLLIKI